MKDISSKKMTMRAEAIKRRSNISSQRAREASFAIIKFFSVCLGRVTVDATVGMYWPIRHEIDVRPLMFDLEKRGVKIALPTITAKNKLLEFRRWTTADILVSGVFGTKQPKSDNTVAFPNVLVVPMLAFDTNGFRLGYGGGYYDRTISELRKVFSVMAIGVAFAEQEFSEIPVEEGDQALDVILTDRRLIQVGA